MSDDLISRQAAKIAFIEKGQRSRRYKLGEIWELNGLEIREVLDNLPSVQTKGTWIAENSRPKSFMFVCSLCRKKAYDRPYGSAKRIPPKVCKLAYCPNCGAKMEVEHDDISG